MALFYPSDRSSEPRDHHKRRGVDLETMFSGLLMGFAALAFAACLLLVINGRAEQLLRLRFGRASSEKSVTLDKPSPTEVTAFKR